MKFSEFNLPQNPRIAYLIILFILSFLPLKASNLECKLDDLKMEKTNCSADQTFYAIINFKHDGTSDCFTLEGNGSQYGQFLYSDLPIKIGPLKGNCETNYEFLIKDCHNENCVLEGSLGKVCCEKGSECKLYEPIISKSPCDAKGEFLIKVKFQYQNISDSFNVFDHTKKYLGRFSYVKLPVLLGPFSGDCHTNYRFIIRDYKNERCALELEIGTVCCTPNQDCKLEGLKIEKTSCTPEKEFYTIINFQYKNTSECFTLSGNGHQYGSFNYSQLPLKIGPLKANCETNYEFVVRDCKNERCSIEGNLGKVCCETGSGDCQLSGLKMVKTACNVEKEFFTYINFVYRNNSECFTIKGNGHDYGTFKYSQLPLKIGPLKGNCETEYEFAIRDCKNEHCALEGNLGKVCCEGTGSGRDCNISGLNVTRSECSEEGLFYVKLNFNYKNTSECFVVKQNDHILGKFEYNKLPIELGPFKGDCTTEYYFSVYDCLNERCTAKASLGKVCCEQSGGDCEISNLKYEKTPCNDHQEFYIYFNFLHKNTSECFSVKGNGIDYGKFKYADLPIKIGPLKGNCETEYEFVFTDCINEKCHLVKEVGKVCCEQSGDCEIKELTITKSECTQEGTFFVKLNLFHKNTSECFVVKQNDHILGKFEYNKLPIELGPFKGDCTTEYYFSVYDCLNERCAAKASLGKVCCEQSGGDCEISNLKYEKTPCNDHQEFYIYFNFLHKNTSECFSVKGNGIDYGKFKYADLPIKIGPLKGNCETEYEFVFTDCINEKCHLVKEVGKVCCETHSEDCRLSELKIEKTKCEADKTFFAILNFDHKNNSDCFIVSGNGIQYGRFLYSQLPVKIGPLKANCETEYEFVVRDCENEKCVSKGLLGKVCCEDSKLCELSNLELGRTECNAEGFFSIKLNFKYKNVSECFVVRQNNNVLGKFKYSQLPLTLGKFKGDCTTNYLFTITDCLSERCGIRKELGRVCCKPISSTCSLTDLKFEKTSCNENKEVYLVINFNSKNTSDCFTVNGNGHNYGTFQYKDLPVKIGPLKANCETKYELVIRDSKNERCVLEKEIGVLCCDRLSGACEISNLIVKPLECTGKSMYAISLNFNHTGTKGIGFDLFDASGKNIGFYSYRTLPLTIKEFKASGNDTDYLKVCENDNEKCCAEVKFDALKCLTAFPGNFSLDLVEIRYANDHLIIWSPNPFPEKFYYYVSDASGKDQLLHEVFRDKNQIGLNTGTLLNGIYLIKLQDQFRIQNLKYIK